VIGLTNCALYKCAQGFGAKFKSIKRYKKESTYFEILGKDDKPIGVTIKNMLSIPTGPFSFVRNLSNHRVMDFYLRWDSEMFNTDSPDYQLSEHCTRETVVSAALNIIETWLCKDPKLVKQLCDIDDKLYHAVLELRECSENPEQINIDALNKILETILKPDRNIPDEISDLNELYRTLKAALTEYNRGHLRSLSSDSRISDLAPSSQTPP